MAIEINNRDYLLEDDPVETQETDETEESYIGDPTNDYSEDYNSTEESNESTTIGSDNGVYDFLRAHGIEDPSKIKFESEDGSNELEEVDFNDLSPEEQKNILDNISDPGYSDYEKDVINYLRRNNITLDGVIDYFSKQAVNNYRASQVENTTPTYTVDDLSDDQLYVAHLKTEYQDFTNEQLLSMLDSAKKDENLYKSQVDTLRTQYKALEDQERIEAAQREQMEYQDLQNSLVQAVGSLNEFVLDGDDPESDSLVLEDSDKQAMLQYLLSQDATGKSQLAKDLENPDTLAELALLRIKGAELLAGTTRYYKNELAKVHAENKKLKAQLGDTKPISSVVRNTRTNNKNNFKNVGSIESNYFDKLI